MAAALKAVNGRERIREYLRHQPLPDMACLVAVGKAATAMTRGAVDVLGNRLVSGLVIGKRGLRDPLPPQCHHLDYREGGHPLPDASSLQTGRALVQILDQAPRDAVLYFLISGGASSLVELPPEGVTLADLKKVNAWLLASGWDIGAVNGVRKGMSCLKGGRLARHLAGRTTYNLLISDVPGNDPAVIGSGLLAADRQGSLFDQPDLPPWIRRLLVHAPPLPAPGDPCFDAVRTHVVASNQQAVQAAARYLEEQGHRAHVHDELLTEDVHRVALRISDRLKAGPSGVHVWGGEPTVKLPPQPGRGGRNLSLALDVAVRISGYPITFISIGTDGDDGGTGDAGAVVDGHTMVLGGQEGLEAGSHLSRADAGSYMEAIGALVHTGPTGTNVMDLMIGLSPQGSI